MNSTSQLNPQDDGVKFINVYSKGKTLLGKLLTNFRKLPTVVGTDGLFNTLEGYWYWKQIQLKDPNWARQNPFYDKQLRNCHGAEARKLGIIHGSEVGIFNEKGKRLEPLTDEFKDAFKAAMRQKLKQHGELANLLKYNQLPLVHFYVFEVVDKRTGAVSEVAKLLPRHQWQLDYWQELKETLL